MVKSASYFVILSSLLDILRFAFSFTTQAAKRGTGILPVREAPNAESAFGDLYHGRLDRG